ncbi:MAG TPA: GntR family transcriptional regulator [Beijerinckiaceae bacterium]|nr:GntR family transcriptional regulator [Beijerinckiaceae bacterium]
MDGRQALGFRPLYRQVRELLEKRIAEGLWPPGSLLPSEGEIAADLGVSQGTVRKALDEMTARNLLVRRQGRGTFVARHDEARILFQFFKLVADEEERAFPESRVLSVRVEAAGAAAGPLAIGAADPAIAIERVRSLQGIDCIAERIVLPARLFPGLEGRDLPNNLYQLFAAEYGVTIARASERLKAVAAGPREAERLGVAAGTPLLSIDRVAFQLDDRPTEWRVSLCRTDRFHYRSELR